MKNSVTDQLNECLRECMERYDEKSIISPQVLAANAIEILDPEHAAPVPVEWGCNLQLRVLARKLLGKEFDPLESDDSGQIELFSGLQARYPGIGDRKECYVPLMDLTLEEFEYNIDRMEKEIGEKQKHVDALIELKKNLLNQGHFHEEA